MMPIDIDKNTITNYIFFCVCRRECIIHELHGAAELHVDVWITTKYSLAASSGQLILAALGCSLKGSREMSCVISFAAKPFDEI